METVTLVNGEVRGTPNAPAIFIVGNSSKSVYARLRLSIQNWMGSMSRTYDPPISMAEAIESNGYSSRNVFTDPEREVLRILSFLGLGLDLSSTPGID